MAKTQYLALTEKVLGVTLSSVAHVASSASFQAHRSGAQHGKNGSYLVAGHTLELSGAWPLSAPGTPFLSDLQTTAL